jgi:hypothetical protein
MRTRLFEQDFDIRTERGFQSGSRLTLHITFFITSLLQVTDGKGLFAYQDRHGGQVPITGSIRTSEDRAHAIRLIAEAVRKITPETFGQSEGK